MTHITMEVGTRGRFVALYYLLTILMGALVLLFHGKMALTIDVIATVFYLALTALFYDLSKTGNRER